MIVKTYLLQTLLNEYKRQLEEALSSIQVELQSHVEPEPVRVWNNPLLLLGGQPGDDDPPENWHWEERRSSHPALADMEAAIERFGAFIDGIGKSAD